MSKRGAIMPTAQEYTELSEQITKYVRIAMTYARKNPNSHAVPMEKDVTNILLNLITLHTEKSELVELIEQIENLYLCKEISFDTYENELADLDERIDQLTNPTEGENK